MTQRRTFLRTVASRVASRIGRRRPAKRGRSHDLSRRFASRAAGFEPLEDRRLLATVVLTPLKDNTLYDRADTVSNGVGDYLFSGATGGGNIGRALLAFDLATADIPAGARIHEVSLELSVSRTSSAANSDMAIHRLTSDWGEGSSNASGTESQGAAATSGDATWAYAFFNTDTWTTPGGDLAATASATASVGDIGTTGIWSSAAMIADVEAWLDAPATNFGWGLVGDEATNQTIRRFDSKDNSNGIPPQLAITFFESDQSLIVSIDAQEVSENGGATSLVVSRANTVGDLTVNLSSSDTGQAAVEASVTIVDGQATSDPVLINAVNDALLDGTQTITITAAALGYESGNDTLDVTDDETTLVRVSGGTLMIEDAADEATDDHLTIAIDGSDLLVRDPNNSIATDIASASGQGTNELRVPLTAFAGQLSLDTKGGDDSLILDGTLENALAEGLSFFGGPGEDSLSVAGAGVSLRLSQFTDVDRVDITGSGNNMLEVDLASAQNNVNDTSDSLTLVSDFGDSFVFDEGWSIPDTLVVGGSFFRVVRQTNTTLHVKGPADWQNPVQPLDVTGDNEVVPRDALLIINELNQPAFTTTAGVLLDAASLDPFPLQFFDVLGNGFAAPSDAIRVIDFLNDQIRSAGEGESTGQAIEANVADQLTTSNNGPWQSQPFAVRDRLFAADFYGPRMALSGVILDGEDNSSAQFTADQHQRRVRAVGPSTATGREHRQAARARSLRSLTRPTWSIAAVDKLFAPRDSRLDDVSSEFDPNSRE